MQYIIYSPSEIGFWSNVDGWVDDLPSATRFNLDETHYSNLPMSVGNDAEFMEESDVQYL